MKTATKLKILISFFLLIISQLCLGEQRKDEYTILILHSYHPAFVWNVEINQGIEDVFAQQQGQFNILIEYLDSKRLFTEEKEKLIAELFRYKFRHTPLDLMIVSDDDALLFIKKYRQEIFDNVPVVFCGINNYQSDIQAEYPYFTGVFEQLDKQSTVETAIRIFPQTQEIFFVGDQSTTSLDLSVIFRENYQKNFPGLHFNYIHTSNLDKLIDSLNKTEPENALIFLWPYLNQDSNTIIRSDKATRKIADNTRIPVFGFWHFMLGHGIIGGKLVSGTDQGTLAAEMAVRILNGEHPSSISPVKAFPNQFFFDEKQLQKFTIKAELLPDQSITINKQVSFFMRNRRFFLALFFVAIIFSLILFINQYNNIVINKALKGEINFQETLINSLPNPLFYTFDNTTIQNCNIAFEKLTGFNRKQLEGQKISSLYPHYQEELHKGINEEVLMTHTPAMLDGQIISNEGKLLDVIFYKSAVFNNKIKKYGIIETIVDVTDKKSNLEAIKQSEERYALATKATKDGIWDWNVKQKSIFLSDPLKEMIGNDSEEKPLSPKSIKEFIHEADFNIFDHQMDLLLEGVKDSFVLEIRLKKKQGGTLWVESSAFALTDTKGEVTRIVGSISDISTRKESEKTLIKWQEIFNNTLMGIAIIGDPDKLIIELMNPVFAKLHGYKEKELVNASFETLVAHQDKKYLNTLFSKAIREGHYVMEISDRRKNGDMFPANIDITAVKGLNGEFMYFIVNLQDISARKKHEDQIALMLQNEQAMNEELRRADEELRQNLQSTIQLKEELEEKNNLLTSFINGTSDLVILKDQQFRYLTVNKSFADVYKLNPEDITGKEDKDITSGKIVYNEREYDLRVIKENKTIIYENEHNGRYFETRKFPVNFGHKKVGIGAFIRDITRQHTIEMQLQKNEQRFRTLLENSFDLITLTDENGTILYCTDALEKITGKKIKEAVGLNFKDLIHPDDKVFFDESLKTIVSKKCSSLQLQHKLISNDPKGYKSIETIATNHLQNTLINAIVFTSRDVSIEVQSRELRKNIALAQKSAEIKQQFLANMSHEIRTPMNGIIGMIEFLLKTQLSETQIDYANTIKSSADSLLNIINDILDFSKIEAGKLNIHPVPVNIKKFATEAPKIFSALVKQKQLNFSLHFDESLPEYLDLDPLRLNQVISNLLSNAIKFTAKGAVQLRIMPDKITSDYVNLRIEVIDSGIGISEQEQKKLFLPFSQIDSSLTRSQEGTGLGLTICRRITELMNGEIGVISQRGKGSMFWLSITTPISDYEKVRKFVEEPIDPETTPLNINILLVEDKRVNQKVITIMLQSLGCKVKLASNGKEAIEIVENRKQLGPNGFIPAFDVILMDIQMPVMDGITATRHIKRFHPEYKVIIGLSANVFAEDVESFLRNGLDDFIGKPANSDELFKKLLYWSGKRTEPGIESTSRGNAVLQMIQNEPVCDPLSIQDIKQQAENNEMVLLELFHSFEKDASELISKIKNSEPTQSKTAMDCSRVLRNMANSMGALQLARICDYIIDNIGHPVIPFDTLYNLMQKALKAYILHATGKTTLS